VKIDNFFAELKRRNVYKVAVAYGVVGWLVMQVAATIVPALHLSDSITSGVVLLVILGFPIALVLAWAFELTPEGIKRAEDVDPNEPTRRTGRKVVGLLFVLTLIAAGLFGFRIWKKVGMTNQASSQSEMGRLGEASLPAPAKSIAVLPFDNLSKDPENSYFSEGIQDEILTRLAKIAELKVVSRTSTLRFKSAPGDLRQIAQQLGVTNILEGSVQKAGDQVRVTVQLINASSDAHLWAESYDRKLTDIFAVESEIARTVAETLQAKLTGSAEHVLASRPTENPEAHQLYLKGRYFWNRRTEENIKKAINYFEQAIEKDPSYALAYAGLSDGYSLMPIYGNNPPREDIQRAIAAAHRALELDDGLAEAHTSLGNALVDDLQFPAADAEFKRAIALNPNYATAHQWYGESLQGQGRFEQALAELKIAHELDPLSIIINSVLGSNLGTAGRHDEAIQQFRRTLEMDPNFGPAQFMLGQIFEGKGDMKEALAAYEKARAISPTPIRLAMVARMYVITGRKAEARKILDDLTSRSQREFIQSYPLALIHLAFGEKEEALRLLEKAYEERGIQLGGNTGTLKADKRLDPLRGDPRFDTLVAKFMGQAK
jgi:TolB-like protein/Tfp pilus assembly protein PilF